MSPIRKKPIKYACCMYMHAACCSIKKVICRFFALSLPHFGDYPGTSRNLVLLKRCKPTSCDWSAWSRGWVIHVFLPFFFSSGVRDLLKAGPGGGEEKKREKGRKKCVGGNGLCMAGITHEVFLSFSHEAGLLLQIQPKDKDN